MLNERPLRLVVTGRNGQVARALTELSGIRSEISPEVSVFTLSRPDFDLAADADFAGRIAGLKPDVIVNAAAYTAVDRAESERDLAFSINAGGAGRVARAAKLLSVPIIQVSTDYVFDGNLARPYIENDPTAPVNFYGVTKLAGEVAVCSATPDHVILRTSWVYAPFGQNFVLTMLKLGAQRDELRVVGDQHGAPTSAFDIATTIATIARHLVDRPGDRSLRGVFHMTNQGSTTWAGFASEIFRFATEHGGSYARVVPIPTSQYPTPAKRPISSRLATEKLAERYGVRPAPWASALRNVVDQIINLGH
jgi:dTDP-4-dehydrorhamnose reductase